MTTITDSSGPVDPTKPEPPTGDGSGINTGNGTSTTNALIVGFGLLILLVGVVGVRKFARKA
jgi:LPXTG-motif cell wall-anchored protein